MVVEKCRLAGLVLAALALGACAGAPSAETGEPVETRSSVDRAVATTGDLITYRVVVDYDPAYEVEIPEPGAEIAGFRIVDAGGEPPRREGERLVEERWYRLRADLVGSYVLPPVAVAYRPSTPTAESGSDEAQTVETSAIFVEVESVLTADDGADDIRGLKPLRRVKSRFPWLPVSLAAAALAIAALAWRRWRNRPRLAIPAPPAHEVAFAALDRLRRVDADDPEAVRRFHFELSEVVRAYVEGRFGLNATDLTTEEILAWPPRLAELTEPQRQALERVLIDTDRVKFAKHRAAPEEIEATYERTLRFVEETRPHEQEELRAA